MNINKIIRFQTDDGVEHNCLEDAETYVRKLRIMEDLNRITDNCLYNHHINEVAEYILDRFNPKEEFGQ
jgi:hypothetical protein